MSVAPITTTRCAAIDKMPRILHTGDKKTGLITLADSGRQFSLLTRHSLVLSFSLFRYLKRDVFSTLTAGECKSLVQLFLFSF
jgi:hypothetical protein